MATFSADERRQLADSGAAMPDGSYPIRNRSDLENAIRAVGRGSGSHDEIRRHIIKRARALALTDLLPEDWSAEGAMAQDGFPTTDGNLALPAGMTYDGDYRMEGRRRVYDPDRDGDDDSTPEGDTNHSHFHPDGSPRTMPMMDMMNEFAPVLILEGNVPHPLIQEMPSAANGGVMKVRTPFFVGDSVARAPGIKKPIFFGKDILPAIVQEGNRQIGERKQPITIYARHAHAADGEHLPLGAVVSLEQEGRIGYATMEISPTSSGRDAQVLIQNGHLNAVSLRSGAGRFELKDVLVNEQPMYTPTKLFLDGIDFAPDGPAQATYGLEILQERPSVEDAGSEEPQTKTTKKGGRRIMELTLEAIRAENPSLIAEIEAPLRRELTAVTQERDALLEKDRKIAREAKLKEIAERFPKPDEAYPVLLELCRDCTTDDQVAAKAFPVLLEALGQKQAAEAEDPRRKLVSMYSGRGQRGLVQEPGARDLDTLTDVAGA